jgi:taurine dioxygenase
VLWLVERPFPTSVRSKAIRIILTAHKYLGTLWLTSYFLRFRSADTKGIGLRIQNLQPFGVELLDFDTWSSLSDQLDIFLGAFQEHSLVLIRDPKLTPESQVRLLGHLGEVIEEIEDGGMVTYVSHDPDAKQSADFGAGEMLFHYDLPATDDWPYQVISLFGETVTVIGGETLFAHGGLAYQRMSEAAKSIVTDRRAIHVADPYAPPTTVRPTEDAMGSFAERGIHPIVRRHPYGRGEVLTVDYATTARIVGMTEVESAPVLAEAFAALYGAGAIYAHRWIVGDLLIWDNRVVQHARRNFPLSQTRKLRRVVIGDGKSIRARYQRWFEQIPIEPNSATKYRRGRVLYPGDRGVWFGMKQSSEDSV